jgi:hypothetical protein
MPRSAHVGICGGQSGTVTGFSLSFSVLLCIIPLWLRNHMWDEQEVHWKPQFRDSLTLSYEQVMISQV